MSEEHTQKAAEALVMMRSALDGVLRADHDDELLLSFLQAQKYDVTKASNMFRKCLEWRRDVGADTVLTDYTPPEVLKNYFMGGIVGTDKDGAVLIIQAFGRMDFRGLMKSTSRQEIFRHHTYYNEIIFQRYRKEHPEQANRRTRVVTTIMDMDGVSFKFFWKPGLQLFTELLSCTEANYPGVANRVLIINAPPFFSFGYNILSPFMSAGTSSAVHIIKGDYKEELLKFVNRDQLPVYYGGSKVGPGNDIKCANEVCYCGDVPKSYYTSLDKTNANELVLHKSKVECIDVQIREPGSILCWQISTDNHEIAFGISTDGENNDDPREVLPTRRIVSHHVPECDSVTCDTTGTYTLMFDISFSHARKRKILYTVEVIDSLTAENEGKQ